eukprot:3497489-Rhodomonas_salina.1
MGAGRTLSEALRRWKCRWGRRHGLWRRSSGCSSGTSGGVRACRTCSTRRCRRSASAPGRTG